MASWRDDQVDTVRRERIKQLFDQTLDCPAAERLAFLSATCGDDERMFEAVRELISDFEAAGSLLNTPLLQVPSLLASNQPAQFSAGELIADRFAIVRLIGRGGMGEVYEVEDSELSIKLALKTIRSDLATDERYLRRLKQELHLARRVTHPNVCRVFDFGRHISQRVDGISFLTMELLNGRTLAEHIHENAPLDHNEALPIIRQVAAGLDAAHSAGIIHRDLKPGNIMLVAGEGGGLRAVVTDFGLARPATTAETLAASGDLAGTLAYMAPEQLQGRPATRASDIYALGVITHEILTSSRGHSRTLEIRGQDQLHQSATGLRALNGDLEKVINKCVSRDPQERYSTANQLVVDLGRCAQIRNEKPHSRFRRHSAILFLTIAALLALSVAALRLSNRRALIPAGSSVLVTEVSNQTADDELDAASDVLLHELSQSARFNIIERSKVRAILQQMAQPYRQQLDPGTAREIIWRAGGSLVVYGSINRLGPAFTLAVRLEKLGERPDTPPHSWYQSFPANDKRDLFGAIEAASQWIRKMAGEEPSRFPGERPPQDTTTSSWEALLLFSQAEKLQALDHTPEAIELLQKAVQVDPDFALAYMRLGDLSNYVENDRDGFGYWKKALSAMQQRPLTKREELRIKGLYAADTGDHTTARDAFHQWEVLYAGDYLPTFYLAGSLISEGRYDEAIQKLNEAERKQPTSWYVVARRARCNLARGRYDEVNADVARLQRMGQLETAELLGGAQAFIHGEYGSARELLGRLSSSEDDYWKSTSFAVTADFASELGDYGSAKASLAEGIQFDLKKGRMGSLADKEIAFAYLAWRTNDRLNCKANSLAAIRHEAGQSHLALAGTLLARCGFSSDARVVGHELKKLPEGPIFDLARHRLEGELLLSREETVRALDEFQAASKLDEADNPREYLARALMLAGRKEEALRAYQNIVESPGKIWQEPDLHFPGLWADALSEYAHLNQGLHNSDVALNRYFAVRKQSQGQEQRANHRSRSDDHGANAQVKKKGTEYVKRPQ